MSSDDFELEFVYNDEGIRTQKIVNGVVHTYHLSGTDIIAEEWGNNLIIYLYDSNGSPMGMQYRRSSMAEDEFYTFWFEKNLQGDIVAVYNSAGTKVVSYAYDAWGNCIVTNHNISGTNSYATFNPFRYRGYYYDTELGFYYLNSRYYDPAVGRFINADVYVSTGQGLLGYNMFAYCLNDPVSHKDDQGTDTVSVTEGDAEDPTPDEMFLGKGGCGGGGGGTVVYRWHCPDASNLVPSEDDFQNDSPLSLSTRYRPGSAMTTIEQINSTGCLYAEQDGPSHVSVYPLGGTIAEWYRAGVESIWTKALEAIMEFLN